MGRQGNRKGLHHEDDSLRSDDLNAVRDQKKGNKRLEESRRMVRRDI